MKPARLSEIRRTTNPYSPLDLAAWLDTWALRRGKVLELIDIAAARRARQLAERCRRLSNTSSTERGSQWTSDWTVLKLEVATFLTEHRSSCGPGKTSVG